jgi:hypothetical protein
MYRSARFSVIGLAAVLTIVALYTVYWFVVAWRIEDGLVAWAQSSRADKVDISWRELRISGFPSAFRVELQSVAMSDAALTPSSEFRVPSLSGSALPWDLADWRLIAKDGLTADLAGAGAKTQKRIMARTAEGTVSIASAGGWNLWLKLGDGSVGPEARVRVGSTDAWIEVPPSPPQGRIGPKLSLAFAAHRVELPMTMGRLGNTVDELDLAATVHGAIPNRRLAEALVVWRDAGGTVDLERLRVQWGGLAVTAAGTISLDDELQPAGMLSAAVEGYDQILTALVEGGRIKAADAGLARIALRMLAKAGPDGEPEIKTSLTIRNGQVSAGPAKLGNAPRLTWD